MGHDLSNSKHTAHPLQGLLVVLAVAHFLVPLPAMAARNTKLVPLAVQSDKMLDADKAAATKALRDVLAKYTKITLLDTPTTDLFEVMMELECTDIDADCLGKMGEHHKSEQLLHTVAKPQDGGSVKITMQLIKSGTSKVLKESTQTAAKKADVAKALGAAVEDIFGKLAAPKVKSGIITIESNVEGATIYLNKKNIGKTPKKVKLKPGKYQLKLVVKGHQELNETLVVADGEKRTAEYTLVADTVLVKKDPDPIKKDPIKEPVKEDPKDGEVTPFYATWWFWTIIGVGVAGGVTAAVVLSQGDEPAPTGVMATGWSAPDYDPLVREQY